MEQLPNDAMLICAHLLRQGYLKKTLVPTLELDEQLFADVQGNLEQVGMEMVFNSYSPYYAIRAKQEVQNTVEQSTNLGLKNNEVAMLVILWSKLILPKRLANEAVIRKQQEQTADKLNQDENAVEKQQENGEEASKDQPEGQVEVEKAEDIEVEVEVEKEEKEGKTDDKIRLRYSELFAEFGEHFGSKTAFKSVLTRLSKMQFIRVHNEIISEGILLDLLVDGYQMANEIKKSALAYKLAGLDDDMEDWEDEEDDYEDTEEEGEDEVYAGIEYTEIIKGGDQDV